MRLLLASDKGAFTLAILSFNLVRRSKLILFITLADIAFASKYSVSAAAFLLGAQAQNSSFGLLPDGCAVAAAWGQFWAMASASWNVSGCKARRADCIATVASSHE